MGAFGDLVGKALRDPLVGVALAWLLVRTLQSLAVVVSGHPIPPVLESITTVVDSAILLATGAKMVWRILRE